MLLAKLKAFAITIDALIPENLPGPLFTKIFDMSSSFVLYLFSYVSYNYTMDDFTYD